MQTFEKLFIEFLRHYDSCVERLKTYKISSPNIQALFNTLDRAKKGYLDVGDLFQIDPNITEDQLFFVFKWFDNSRCGYLTHQDFRKILQSDSETTYDTNDPERCFKNFLRILKATYYSIENRKKELQMDEFNLRKLYEKIQSFSGKVNIDINSIMVYLEKLTGSHSLVFSNSLEKILSKEYLNMETFVNSFKVVNSRQHRVSEEKAPEKKSSLEKYGVNIDEILKKYENRPALSLSHKNENYQVLKDNFVHEEKRTTSPVNQNLYDHCYIDDLKVAENIPGERTEKIYVEAEKLLDSELIRNRSAEIKRRKEELRRGSLERKKIIQDIMNKKYYTSKIQPNDHKLHLDKRYYVEQKNIPKRPTKKYDFQNQFVSQGSKTPKNVFEESVLNVNRSPERVWERYEKEELLRDRKPEEMFQKSSSTSGFHKTIENSYPSHLYHSKSNLKNFYRRPGSDNYEHMVQKENILKRAEEEAAKKIEEIERKARLKVMEKKSAFGSLGKWHK